MLILPGADTGADADTDADADDRSGPRAQRLRAQPSAERVLKSRTTTTTKKEPRNRRTEELRRATTQVRQTTDDNQKIDDQNASVSARARDDQLRSGCQGVRVPGAGCREGGMLRPERGVRKEGSAEKQRRREKGGCRKADTDAERRQATGEGRETDAERRMRQAEGGCGKAKADAEKQKGRKAVRPAYGELAG